MVNCVINDYRSIAAESGGSIKGCRIEHKDYVRMMARDLLVSTIASKKLLWDKATLMQLVRSENREIRNVGYIFSYFIEFTVTYLLKLVGIGVENRRTRIAYVDGNPLEKIDDYLSAKSGLGNAKSFPDPGNKHA